MVFGTTVNLTRETENGIFYLFGSENVPIECESKKELELIYNAIQKLGEYERYIQYPENIPHIINENKRLDDENEKIAIENDRLRAELAERDWIPVAERLPEKDGEYDITYRGIFTGDIHYSVDWFRHDYFMGYRDLVIAWRPLSKPYKPEENK